MKQVRSEAGQECERSNPARVVVVRFRCCCCFILISSPARSHCPPWSRPDARARPASRRSRRVREGAPAARICLRLFLLLIVIGFVIFISIIFIPLCGSCSGILVCFLLSVFAVCTDDVQARRRRWRRRRRRENQRQQQLQRQRHQQRSRCVSGGARSAPVCTRFSALRIRFRLFCPSFRLAGDWRVIIQQETQQRLDEFIWLANSSSVRLSSISRSASSCFRTRVGERQSIPAHQSRPIATPPTGQHHAEQQHLWQQW